MFEDQRLFPLSFRTKVMTYILVVIALSSGITFSFFHASHRAATLEQIDIASNNSIKLIYSYVSMYTDEFFNVSRQIYNNEKIISTLQNVVDSNGRPDKEDIELLQGDLTGIKQNSPVEINLTLYIKSPRSASSIFAITQNGVAEIMDTDVRINYTTAAAKDGSMIFIPPNRETKGNAFFIYRLIKNNRGQSLGVLKISSGEMSLSSYLQAISLPDSMAYYIVDTRGVIIADSRFENVGARFSDVAGAAPEFQRSGATQQSEGVVDSKTCVMYSMRHYFDNWGIIVVSFQNILSVRDALIKYASPIIVYIFLLFLLTSLFISQHFIKPIQELEKGMRSVSEGDLSKHIIVQSNDELGRIQSGFNDMQDGIARLLRENYQIRIQENEARIKALEAQINPHFLYNTLDIINWQAYMSGAKNVSKLIQALSKILRYNLNDEQKIVAFETEIGAIEEYLFIMTQRDAGKYTVSFDLKEETKSIRIHKQLLQPIVENAVLYGLRERSDGGILKISSWIQDDKFYISIYDNGKGMPDDFRMEEDNENIIAGGRHGDSDVSKRKHIGLKNVRSRIRSYYGEEYGLKIQSVRGRFTEVILVLPVNQGETGEDGLYEKRFDSGR